MNNVRTPSITFDSDMTWTIDHLICCMSEIQANNFVGFWLSHVLYHRENSKLTNDVTRILDAYEFVLRSTIRIIDFLPAFILRMKDRT